MFLEAGKIQSTEDRIMGNPIRPKEAWESYAKIHEHIQTVGMVDSETDRNLKLLEDFIRQEMEKQS